MAVFYLTVVFIVLKKSLIYPFRVVQLMTSTSAQLSMIDNADCWSWLCEESWRLPEYEVSKSSSGQVYVSSLQICIEKSHADILRAQSVCCLPSCSRESTVGSAIYLSLLFLNT